VTTPPRLYVEAPLTGGSGIALGPSASRHAQVLRLQPGDAITLVDGHGGHGWPR
jgi:16S rRNA (uracil1498-N3)-methyltransferase